MMVPLTIHPTSVYTEEAVSRALGIPLSTIAKARRDGSLPCTRRGHRTLILGTSLLAWLTPSSPNAIYTPQTESTNGTR